MKIDFLQIGFQKCGTTFLEKNVYPHNPNIHCIQATNNLELERFLLKNFILPDSLEYDQSVINDVLPKIVEKLFKDNTVNGIMFEPFTFLYQRRIDRKNVIDRIKITFPNIKIITFLRNQKTWLLSHYSQYLKSGGLLSLNDFIECLLNNVFLESHHIDWFPLISYLYTVFNKENVLVCLYEDLKRLPQGVADRIFTFLNVPHSKINPDIVNPSLSSYGLSIRRFLNHFIHFDCGASTYTFSGDLFGAQPSPYSRFQHRLIYSFYKPVTNKLCYKIDEVLKLKKRIHLNDSQIQKINDRYALNNEKLSKLLNVDLSKYDYPLP